jgi:hypothetical protein
MEVFQKRMGGCPGLLKYRRFYEVWEAGNYGKIKRFIFKAFALTG